MLSRLMVLVLALLPPGLAAAPPQLPTPVEVVVLQASGPSETLRLTGTVTALRRAELSPRLSGLVSAVGVEVGTRVRAGEPLLELDPTLARLALQREQAALGEARARLREAERRRDEARRLVARGFLPQTRLAAAESELEIAHAGTVRLEAQLREAGELLARHRVEAPFDGVVVRRMTEIGEWVSPGEAIFELVASDAVRIDVQVPQERIRGVRAGAIATVIADADSERRLRGRVTAVVPAGSTQARSFPVLVELLEGAGELAPGMSVAVELALAGNGPALTLPRDAVVRLPEGAVEVWIAEPAPDGRFTAQRRRVRLAPAAGDWVSVAEGLEPGLRVIVRGNERLRPSEPLRLVEPPKAGE